METNEMRHQDGSGASDRSDQLEALGLDLETQPVNEGRWTGDQWAFIVWEATPSLDRSPKTLRDMAAILGVSERTLFRWKKTPGFWEEVRAIAKAELGPALPDIYAALRREAVQGSFLHIRLCLELAGELTAEVGNRPFQITTYNYAIAIAPLEPQEPQDPQAPGPDLAGSEGPSLPPGWDQNQG